jgi:cystathionine beta-lyase
MSYDFDTLLERPSSSLKLAVTDPEVIKAGNISFDGAEPDYHTAPVIRDAVIKMANRGYYGFTLCDTVYEDAVCSWMRNVRGFSCEREWVVPTLGTIHSAATAIRMATKEGDGIIISVPVYNRYEQAANRLGRKTVKCQLKLSAAENRYTMDFEAIEYSMKQEENKLYILCNPHNPIGQIWKEHELVRLAELANQYGVIVFSDEIFAENSYFGNTTIPYLSVKGASGHAIVSTSLGKCFHYTGVNHANMIIPDYDLRQRFLNQRDADHYGSIDPFAYESVLAAYTEEGYDWLCESNRYVEENIKYIKEFFKEKLPDVPVYGGEGGYILWIDWNHMFSDEEKLIEFLYHKAYFHLDAGSNYDSSCFTRMCVASPKKEIERALISLERAIFT